MWRGSPVNSSCSLQNQRRSDYEFYDKLWKLSPINEIQRAHKDRAIKAIDEVTETRLVLRGLRENAIPTPFLLLLIFWLTVIFASFSLFAEPTPVVMGCLFVCALSAASAIYLVVGMSQPLACLSRFRD
jgi:hypothetical protein